MTGPLFPVHLCQPDPAKSCAACCGIYNFVANSRAQVRARLQRNTVALQGKISLDEDRIRNHSNRYRRSDNSSGTRFQTIFNCEFAGFLNTEGTRIGCLLHPVRHGGSDLRHCSFYGTELCRGHFCPSYYYLTEMEQRLVVNVIEDWYLYGLVITDIDLVKGLYKAASNRLGEGLKPERAAIPALKASLAGFFQLKIDWPFRSEAPDRFGKYRFKEEQYQEIHIPYGRWHRRQSAWHRILIALGSELAGPSDLDRAEALLSSHLAAIVAAYASGNP